MKMQPREKITVALGVAIVLGSLLYGLASRRSAFAAPAAAGSAQQQIEIVREYQTLSRSVDDLSRQLQITVPAAALDDQEMGIRQTLATLAQQKGVNISSIRRLEGGATRNAGLKPIQFQLDFAAPYTSLVRFMVAVEHAPTPCLVLNYSLAVGGPGQVQGTMEVQGYLFPPATPAGYPIRSSEGELKGAARP